MQGDRFAMSGVWQSETLPSLTQAQRWQFGYRLPIPDGTIDDIGDRYALAGVIQSTVGVGSTVETFSLDWLIRPTWNAFLAPQTVTGDLEAAMDAFTTQFKNTNIIPDEYFIPPEQEYVVPAEDDTFTLEAETNNYIVPEETDEYVVLAETNEIEVEV